MAKVNVLPDGSAFFTASLPLPKDHWLTAEGDNEPPMPFQIGASRLRNKLARQITEAARYAIRASTMNGTSENYDPDALVQNLIVGMLGPWDDLARPTKPRVTKRRRKPR